jgi:hypothetical protein
MKTRKEEDWSTFLMENGELFVTKTLEKPKLQLPVNKWVLLEETSSEIK